MAIQKQNEAQQKALVAESARLLSTDPHAAAAAALEALREGDTPEAHQALRAALRQPRPTMTLKAGPDAGAAWWAEMSPQEDLIAVAYHDGTARLWDARTGDLRHALEAGRASGASAAHVSFSKDGSLVVTSSYDGWARVFDTRDGSMLHELGPYHSPVLASFGMARGRHVVLTTAANENPAVWDAATGRMLATLEAPVRAAALSDDGTRVAIGTDDGQLRVWTWEGKGQVAVDPGVPYDDFVDVGFSVRDPNVVLTLDRGTGSLIQWNWKSGKPSRVLAPNRFSGELSAVTHASADVVAVTAEKEVHILDSASGELSQILPDGDDYVNMLAFSRDGRYVARGDNDGTIRVFPVQAGGLKSPPLWVLLGHTGAVVSLAFSQDGTTLMSAAADGSVRVWPLPNRQLAQRTSQRISDAQFSVDGQTIASGGPQEINTSDPRGDRPRSFAWRGGTTEQLRSLALSPDSSYVVATTSQSIYPRVFEVSSGEERLIPFNGQTDWYLTWVDHSPNPHQPWIAVGNFGGSVEMFDVTTGDLLWSKEASDTLDAVFEVRFSADGTTVATATLDGAVKLFDAVSGRELRIIRHSMPVSTVAFTTDGAYLATYAEDRHLRIWSTEGRGNNPVADVVVPVRGNTLAFSPDSASRFLAVAGSDGTTLVYQWEKELKPLAILRHHVGSVNAVAFDPKQPAEAPPRLMSAGDDGTVAIYSCELCSIGDDELEQYARAQLASR